MGFLWRRWASPGPALSRILPSVIAASATPLFLVPAYLTLNPLAVILVGILVAGAALLAARARGRCDRTDRPASRGLLVAHSHCGDGRVGRRRGGVHQHGARPRIRGALGSRLGDSANPGAHCRPISAPSGDRVASRSDDRFDRGRDGGDSAGIRSCSAGGPQDPPFLTPLAAWVLVVVALRVFAIRPMARLATQTAIERELIVDDSEAERRRIAGDIHDDVIQDLTMLVHRLDRDGAAEPADGPPRREPASAPSAPTCACRSSTTWAWGRPSIARRRTRALRSAAKSGSNSRVKTDFRPTSNSPCSASPRKGSPMQ
jgi:signal transduction histidine kinase